MPTESHDILHGFLPEHPRTLERALDLLGLGIPPGVTTKPLPTDVSGRPKMLARHVDSVTQVVQPRRKKPFILVVEAQTRPEAKKRTSWPYYISFLREKHELEVLLLVLCVDKKTADWAAKPMITGVGSRPTQVTIAHVLGPANVPPLTSVEDAAADLDFATFRLWIHSKDPGIEGILTIMGEALVQTEDLASRDILAGLVEDGLATNEAQDIWRTLMQTLFTPRRGTIVGDARLAGREEGREEGRKEEKTQNLLRLLERRGLPVTEEIRQRVTDCAEMPLLDLWFDRAIDAETIDEVFAAPSSTDSVPAPASSPEQTQLPIGDPEMQADHSGSPSD